MTARDLRAASRAWLGSGARTGTPGAGPAGAAPHLKRAPSRLRDTGLRRTLVWMNNDLAPVGRGGSALRLPESARLIDVTVTSAARDHLVAWDADSRRLAIHEASHCIACQAGIPVPGDPGTLVRIPVASVSIRSRHGGRTETDVDADDQPAFVPLSHLRARIVTRLAGLEAEIQLVGEGSDGCAADLEAATSDALTLIDAGLDGDPAGSPFISLAAFGYGSAPAWLADERAKAALRIVASAREQAREIVSANQHAILRFAALLYQARRLEGESLRAAFATALDEAEG